jgi:hypothetical protein
MQSDEGFGRWRQNGEAASPQAHRVAALRARSAVLKVKKRHVEVLTRLPTERLATACWAFIVVKRIGREAAPVLVFEPLPAANKKNYPQDMNRRVHATPVCQKATQPRQSGR